MSINYPCRPLIVMKPLANMFIAIEDYLADPSRERLEALKYLSFQLMNEAHQQAKTKFPDKKIAADHYHPLLQALIFEQAEQAYSESTRLILNVNSATDDDPKYIFRLSQKQQLKIKDIKNLMLIEMKYSPDGLIFSYGGFIERRRLSQFDYCDGAEALIRNYNTSLRLKIRNLKERGYEDAAKVLQQAHEDINRLCKDYCQEGSNQNVLQQQVKDILFKVKNNPLIQKDRQEDHQEHHSVKKFLANFIFALSMVGLIYLAKSSKERGSFWYQPITATENLVGSFINDLPSIKPKPY
jgi:hypothetical protein